MAALTPTAIVKTEFAGDSRVKVFTVVPTTASDTVDLSAHFDTIDFVAAIIETGADSALQSAHPSISGTTVTIVTKGGDGNAASDWTGVVIRLLVVGRE